MPENIDFDKEMNYSIGWVHESITGRESNDVCPRPSDLTELRDVPADARLPPNMEIFELGYFTKILLGSIM